MVYGLVFIKALNLSALTRSTARVVAADESLITRECWLSMLWRLVPYALNAWERSWGTETLAAMLELPHYALELLVVLPLVQVQCFAKCPFTCQFDRRSDQLCQPLDRLSDHFVKHWVRRLRDYGARGLRARC